MVRHAGIRLFEMLKDEVMTDVTFMVQGSAMKGHRNVISSSGTMLRELLESKADQVEIEDVAPHTFQAVLEFLYTDNCKISQANVFELMHASKMFGLSDLERSCAETMKENLNESNVGAFTSEALQFESKEYLKVCEEYFQTHTHEVIKTKEFLEVSNEALVALCSSDSIVCSELDLFLACVAWAKSECQRKNLQPTPENIRLVLGDVLKKLRFPVIPIKDLLEIVIPLEILTFEEVGRIICEIQKKEKRTEFPDELRTNIVQVTVKGYNTPRFPNAISDSKVSVPLSTSISKLKAMKIFCGGQHSYPADKFTLEHKGRELSDDVTLTSIYTPGQDVILQLHSFTYTIKDNQGRWELPLTMKTEEILRYQQMIKGHLYSHKDIEPTRVQIIEEPYWHHPGGTFTVLVKDQ